jgi:ELWxxDGT repeat protein
VSGTLFFAANDGTHGMELWKSDGTMTGTVMVKDINTLVGCNSQGDYPGTGTYPCRSYPYDLTDVDGQLFFAATDGTHAHELWTSDGTVTGTVMVKDINTLSNCDRMGYFPGTGYGPCSSNPLDLFRLGDALIFSAYDGVHGQEPWISDGTVTGTVMIRDISPGTGVSYPGGWAMVGERVFFAADDGVNGRELWSLALFQHGVFLPVVLRAHP